MTSPNRLSRMAKHRPVRAPALDHLQIGMVADLRDLAIRVTEISEIEIVADWLRQRRAIVASTPAAGCDEDRQHEAGSE